MERCLEIISEASRYIPPQLTDKHPEVPWADIRGIGNQLRHAYDQLDGDIIWNTATISVPELKIVIEAMIATLEADAEEPTT